MESPLMISENLGRVDSWTSRASSRFAMTARSWTRSLAGWQVGGSTPAGPVRGRRLLPVSVGKITTGETERGGS